MFALLTVLLIAPRPDSTALMPPGPFMQTIRIIHQPEEIMFMNRPYNLELFVNFPSDSVESVSLFIRTDNMTRYQEFLLPGVRGRYTFRYDPVKMPGKSIRYFFVVRLKPFALFATPLNEDGSIRPVERTFVDPVAYYKWKRAQNR